MEAFELLLAAVETGDAGAARLALERGADPDGVKPRRLGGTPVLFVAAQGGDLDVVRVLLDAGAAADAVSGFEWTPLRAAVNEGHADVVALLLERGVDPNTGGKRGSILAEAVSAASSRPGPPGSRFFKRSFRLAAP